MSVEPEVNITLPFEGLTIDSLYVFLAAAECAGIPRSTPVHRYYGPDNESYPDVAALVVSAPYGRGGDADDAVVPGR